MRPLQQTGAAQMSTPGQDQRAIEELDNEIELRPSKGAYMRRGNAFGDLGQFERAIEDFDRAIQLQPDVLDVYYLRGTNSSQATKSEPKETFKEPRP